MIKDTCAIIVTYNPDFDLLNKQINSLLGQCSIVVIDNSDDLYKKNQILEFCRQLNIQLYSFETNVGIAKAQNTGIIVAKEKFPECQYILLLDQDSIPSPLLVTILHSEYQNICTDRNIAVLGPALYDPRAGAFHSFHKVQGLLYKKIKPNHIKTNSIECTTVNSSGSFFSIKVFEDVGVFNESFFIDHVETEWCFRAINKGYQPYVTNRVKLEHFMGDDVLIFSFFGKKKFIPYRSPLRHHYLFRNSIALLKCGYVPFIWKFYCLIKLVYSFFVFSLFSTEKYKQLKAMYLGIKDGINGLTGKI